MESLGTLPFGRRMKRTLPSVQFRLLRCIFQGFLSASIDASGEVFVFPHLLPMSDESGEARCAFRAEGDNVPAKKCGR